MTIYETLPYNISQSRYLLTKLHLAIKALLLHQHQIHMTLMHHTFPTNAINYFPCAFHSFHLFEPREGHSGTW